MPYGTYPSLAGAFSGYARGTPTVTAPPPLTMAPAVSPYGKPSQKHENRALALAMQKLLASEGRTDPLALNLELTGIGRSTEAQQLGLHDYLAQQGLSSSGLGAALSAAIGASGGEQTGAARARENAATEERRRQDIAMVMQHLMANKNLKLQRRLANQQMKRHDRGFKAVLDPLNFQSGSAASSGAGASVFGSILGSMA